MLQRRSPSVTCDQQEYALVLDPVVCELSERKMRMILGGGVGEGLAAVCGHESGDEGMWVAIPAISLGD